MFGKRSVDEPIKFFPLISNQKKYPKQLKQPKMVMLYILAFGFCTLLGCENGTYGENCNNMCGHCIDGEFCDHTNGSCLNGCNPGYVGDECKTSEFDMFNKELHSTVVVDQFV